jgi:hypothetical protein
MEDVLLSSALFCGTWTCCGCPFGAGTRSFADAQDDKQRFQQDKQRDSAGQEEARSVRGTRSFAFAQDDKQRFQEDKWEDSAGQTGGFSRTNINVNDIGSQEETRRDASKEHFARTE